MNTRKYLLRTSAAFFCFLLTTVTGCKNDPATDAWAESHDIAILAYKSDPENGKQYLNVIYENTGKDTYRKIKYQLIERTGTKTDTLENIIIPETILMPKEKRLVPRHIGESPATWDEVQVGKIWVVKDEKK
ncbi:MAG: hypothetical protein Q8916_07670 [Bacteroidota bacterium]|nr:hypothetical protein [Bacteroidota bacterium]MDP4230271.1 hypothetical protein [Bacteroidota bacterium]MDP4236117.1 hypothetical protein [Bacteroidota bacterium]